MIKVEQFIFYVQKWVINVIAHGIKYIIHLKNLNTCYNLKKKYKNILQLNIFLTVFSLILQCLLQLKKWTFSEFFL